MSVFQPDKTVSEFPKPTGAIHIHNNLTFLQRKIFNTLLYNALDNLLTHEWHHIKARDLMFLSGYESNDHKYFRNEMRKLMSIVVDWNILAEGFKDWEACSAVNKIKAKEGVISYRYDEDLAAHLASQDSYTMIDLLMQTNFRSGYALALWENCVRYADIKQTPLWPLQMLYQLLGIQDGQYSAYKDFGKRILRPAVKSVNEVGNISIEAMPSRTNRRVSAIRFLVERKKLNCDLVGIQANKKQIQLLRHMTDKLHISRKVSENLIRTYPLDYLEKKIEAVLIYYRTQSGVRNLPGFIVKSIKDDWHFESLNNAPVQCTKPKPKPIVITKPKQAILDFETNESQLTNVAYTPLGDEEKVAFEEFIRSKNFTIQSIYQSKGESTILIRSLVFDFRSRFHEK